MMRVTLHRPPRSGSARGRQIAAGLTAALGLAAATALTSAAPASANAPDTTVTVNLAQTGAAPTHVGAGYLYGLSQDGTGPADDWMQPLSPTLFRGGGARLAGDGWIGDGYTAGSGFQTRITSALDQAKRVTAAPYNATYHLLVSDLYGADTTQPSNTVYPCDNGNCSNWTTFIDTVVGDVQASGVKNIDFDIWNEPDGTGFWPRGVDSTQYFQMWDTAVREIRRLDPSAVIVGASFSQYNSSFMQTFLSQTKTDGTLPNVLNWHFGDDPVNDANQTVSIENSLGITPIPLTVNEYLLSNQQNAGTAAWWLDRFAASGITAAAHAIWSDCCAAGTLDDTIAGTGTLAAPTGQWWVYRAYGSLSGNMVSSSSANAGIAVAAAANQSTAQANILIGNDSGQTGTTTISVQGLGSTPWLTAGSTVHATLYRIPDQTPLSTPITVSDSDVTISNGAISVPAAFQSATDAFWLVLSPHGVATPTTPSSSGNGQVIVDGNQTGTGNDEFQYNSNWGETSGVSDMYAGTANWSTGSGATATFRFTGTQVALHAVKDVDQGMFTVAVDGGTPQTIDDYASTRNASGIVWTSPVLAAGAHTLTIVNTGQKNSASSGFNIAIDRADVTPASAQIIVDGNVTGTGNDEFQYGANWGVTTGVSDMYDGTANWSYVGGATATFRFTGTQLALHAVKDVDQGILTVSIDGGTPQSVDDYASSRNASGIVWTSSVLAEGSHTLTIVNTGQKDSASSGFNIAIDRADITP
jgi:Carbohydrate esterase 2 N-terminal